MVEGGCLLVFFSFFLGNGGGLIGCDDFLLYFFSQFGVVAHSSLHGFATLSDFRFSIAEPRAALLDDASFNAEVHDFAYL